MEVAWLIYRHSYYPRHRALEEDQEEQEKQEKEQQQEEQEEKKE